MMYIIREKTEIVGVRDPWTKKEVEEIERDLKKSERLVSASELSNEQIREYLEDVPAWDYEPVIPMAKELCDRLHINFDQYGTMNDLMPAIDNRMDAGRLWYAVMADRDDTDWGFGSHDKAEALRMAQYLDNPDAYVVIVDGNVAIGEINLDGKEIR
jgi:hypothetical protein